MLSKRERLEKAIAGEAVDRAPVALWRAWPGDDQRPADMVKALVHFQQQWDFDFINVVVPPSALLRDYGAQDEWQGQRDGFRTVTVWPVKRSLHWTELPVLDPQRGNIGQQQELLRLLLEAVKGPLPIVLTIYSPMTQAALLSGETLLLKHIRTAPERLKTGLNTLASNLLRLIETLAFSGLAGICYVVQHADLLKITAEEYATFGKPYDLQVLEALPTAWWLNILSVQGVLPMMPLLMDYPVTVLNWQDQRVDDVDLATAKMHFDGALCGGLDAAQTLYQAGPYAVRDEARRAFELTRSRRIILGAGEPLLLGTPQANIRAAREAVDVSEFTT